MAGSEMASKIPDLEKGNKRWKEKYAHPLHIQIREDGHTKNQSTLLEDTRQSFRTDEAERDTIGVGTFTEEFTEDMLEERRGMAGCLLVHHASHAG
jgi:hypothetical protein